MNLSLSLNAAINGDDIVDQLFPNIPILIAHIIATIVLLLVLWRWVYNPFRRLLNSRHLEIKKKLDDAAIKQAIANKNNGDAVNNLNSSKIQAEAIVNDAKNKAYDERKEIIDKAHEEAMRIANHSKRDIERQKNAAQKQIKQEIEIISLEVAEKILAAEINQKKHQEIIDEFIDKI